MYFFGNLSFFNTGMAYFIRWKANRKLTVIKNFIVETTKFLDFFPNKKAFIYFKK